jgi:hypothetical protein
MRQNIHVHGDDSRVNLNSTDNSVNNPIKSNDQLFVRLREGVRSISNKTDRENILARLDDLEKARGSNRFSAAFQIFIVSASSHMTIFGPFIPALTQMLSGADKSNVIKARPACNAFRVLKNHKGF